MIRFCVIILFILIFFIASIVLLPLGLLIGLFNKRAKVHYYYAVLRFVCKVILFLTGANITVLGSENIPNDKPALFVGNHRSYFDMLLLLSYVKKPIGFVAKKESGKLPILRQWLLGIQCLFLDRDNIKQGLQTILAAIEYVKDGWNMGIFPEGTRNKVNNTFLPFHEGSFKIAEKSNGIIVPFAINNSADIYEDHRPHVKKTRVVIEFLPVVDLTTMTKEEKKFIGATVQKMIEERFYKNKETYQL